MKPIASLFLLLTLLLSACTPLKEPTAPVSMPHRPQFSETPSTQPSSSPTPTGALRSLSITETPKAPAPTTTVKTSLATQISISPTPSPFPPSPSSTTTLRALSAQRPTPPTLMLHPSSAVFNSAEFLKAFIQLAQAQPMQAITYQQIAAQPEITIRQQGQLVIITLDDVSLQAPIVPSIQEMIAVLQQAHYPAVLGVVTAGKAADPETARILRELSAQGWEIACHGDAHANLGELEKVDPIAVRMDIRACADKIEQAVGVRPTTLILPYGQMVENAKLLAKEAIVWAVGINGGETYNTNGKVYYVGREGPGGGVEQTFTWILQRFGDKP